MSLGMGMPLCSHIFGYMLIEVPHLRIHADGRESGDGVDLVDVQRSCRGFEEEIDAGHAGALYGAVAGDC
jgi:hypothetical protein